jgi:hypothetical protein
MRILLIVAAGLLGSITPALAQKDFLTPDEVSKVRLVQVPDERLALYTTFAQQRMDLLRTYFADQKPGRSALIHDVLEEYIKIIEAIDTVADDALRRNLAIDKGITVVEQAERAMLSDLERFDGVEATDRVRYDYVLSDALEATRDSLMLASEDVRDRKADVTKRDASEKKQRETMMTPDDIKASRDQQQQQAKEKEKSPGRKLPSLRRPEDATADPKNSSKPAAK